MRQMFCTVLLICCVFILSCSDTEHSIDIAEETLHVAKTEKIPYDTYISESLAGNKHALEEIFHCSHHFDAAAAIGHGLVLYEIRQHDQMFF